LKLGLRAVYVKPGNFLYLLPFRFFRTSEFGENAICVVSSKLGPLHLSLSRSLAKVLHEGPSGEVLIIGKPLGTYGKEFEQNLKTLPGVNYYGYVRKNRLFQALTNKCLIILYLTYDDTWSYTVYESLLMGKIVALVALDDLAKDGILDGQISVFGNLIKINKIGKIYLIRVASRQNLEKRLRRINRDYINGVWYLLTKLLL
jgi:hypothetical protein